MPSLVTREAFLLALAIPFVRKIVSAFARSPAASSSARLQSIMPALVFSRSSLTTLGSIAVFVLIWTKFDNRGGSRWLSGNAGHLDLFANPRFAARRDNCVDQFLQNNSNCTDRVVVSWNGVIDHFRVGVCIDNRDHGNVEPLCFEHCVLFASDIDHNNGVRQLRHFENSFEVPTQLRAFAIERGEFLFAHFSVIRRLLDLLDIFKPSNAFPNRRQIGQRPPKPALIHKKLSTRDRGFFNCFLRLLFAADNKILPPRRATS